MVDLCYFQIVFLLEFHRSIGVMNIFITYCLIFACRFFNILNTTTRYVLKAKCITFPMLEFRVRLVQFETYSVLIHPAVKQIQTYTIAHYWLRYCRIVLENIRQDSGEFTSVELRGPSVMQAPSIIII